MVKTAENKKSLHPCHKNDVGTKTNSVVPPKLPQSGLLKTFLTEGNRRNLFRKLRGGLQKLFANLSFSGQKALCFAGFLIIPIKAYL